MSEMTLEDVRDVLHCAYSDSERLWPGELGDLADAIDAHIAKHAETLQAYTAILARLHDVTTQFEAERASNVKAAHRTGPEWDAIDSAIKSLNGEELSIITRKEFDALVSAHTTTPGEPQ